MSTKILVIEDDAAISRFVSLELTHEGYTVDSVADGRLGLEKAQNNKYDLIVLDVMLPSLNGIEVLRRLRVTHQTPVIILTARDQVMDKVSALDIGANDYITKPFAIEELLARIRVALKHKEKSVEKIYELGQLKIITQSQSVMYGNDTIDLTKKEYDLLLYLVQSKNTVITREKALDAVWGYDYYGNTNVVDVYVRYLRSKIDDKYNIELINTVRGSGYIVKE